MTCCKRMILFMGILLLLTGCGKNDAKEENISFFPYPDTSFVGDPMPYFDGKEMNIFFLEDQRVNTIGYHPWSRYTTKDFLSYEFLGEVIPYGEDINAQDIALGTGSVIKDKDGLYHAFYTGHNDTYSPKEAIMHAISKDLQNWEKIKEDTFYADADYSKDDFRDPYVLWNEKEKKYWMLITTRKENNGVIALYQSEDLKTWQDAGVLFENDMGSDSNLECPSLLEYKGVWYLTFSDQWPDRLVHYRMAKTPYGPFEKPEIDYFDGNGFYAGRLEKAKDKIYMIGWNPTKENHMDEKNYNWAGNLVSHELKQEKNGLLTTKPVESIQKKKADVILKNISFESTEEKIKVLEALEGRSKITGKIQLEEEVKQFGFAFNTEEDGIGTLNYLFDTSKNTISFYNKRTDTLSSQEPQSKVYYDFSNQKEIEFTLLLDNTTACLYINDTIALSARMYGANKKQWSIFQLTEEN